MEKIKVTMLNANFEAGMVINPVGKKIEVDYEKGIFYPQQPTSQIDDYLSQLAEKHTQGELLKGLVVEVGQKMDKQVIATTLKKWLARYGFEADVDLRNEKFDDKLTANPA